MHPKRRGDLQATFDALDVVGDWHWNIQTDEAFAAPLVAKLFNVDPERARHGVRLSDFTANIHDEDRAGVQRLIEARSATGSAYVAKYRVRSADGATRWILARGSFSLDASGEPTLGRGIIVDLTPWHPDTAGDAVTRPDADGSAVDQLAAFLVASYAAIAAEEDTELKLLIDLLLLKIGRRSAKARRALN